MSQAGVAEHPPPAEPTVGRGPSLLQPLRNRNYALLFTGQLTSLVGDQLYVIALPFLILGHAGVRELGLVLMCFGLARIITVPIGGILADRMDKSRLMLLTDVGRGFCVLAVAGLALSSVDSLAPLMALTAVLGALEGLFLAPSYAILPEIVNDEQLPAANSLNTALESAAGFLGPALAGIIVAVFTPGVALAIDAVTFLISAITLIALRRNLARGEGVRASEEDSDEPEASRTGFLKFLAVNRVVQLTLIIVLFSNLAFDAMADVALPVFSRDVLLRGAEGFGIMLSAFGAGALVGGLLADALFRLHRRALVALGLGVVQGVAIALVPIAGGLVGAAAVLFASGVTMGVLNTFYITQLQQRVPAHLLGRTMGALNMCVFGSQPVSVLAAGLVLGTTGTAPVFVAAGLLIVIGYLLASFNSEYRSL